MERWRLRKESVFRYTVVSLRRRLVRAIVQAAAERGYPKLLCIPSDLIGREIISNGLYEEGLLRALFEVALKPHMERFSSGVALDVGANIGNHACFMARYFRRVAAFEPNPTALGILKVNVGLNDLSNVDVFPVGLSSENGTLPFRENAANNLGGSRFVAESVAGLTRKLEVRRGDSVVDSQYHEYPIVLVKLDVEGHELSVLKGLRKTLARHQPIILFEAHTSEGPSGSRAITEYLAGLGYGFVYSIEPRALAERSPTRRKLARLLYGGNYYIQKLSQPEDRPYELLLASGAAIEPGHGGGGRPARSADYDRRQQ